MRADAFAGHPCGGKAEAHARQAEDQRVALTGEGGEEQEERQGEQQVHLGTRPRGAAAVERVGGCDLRLRLAIRRRRGTRAVAATETLRHQTVPPLAAT